MRWAAAIGASAGLLLVAYAGWLLATPDPDGGRRPVGGMVLGPALLILAVSVFGLLRAQRRP